MGWNFKYKRRNLLKRRDIAREKTCKSKPCLVWKQNSDNCNDSITSSNFHYYFTRTLFYLHVVLNELD